MSVQDALFVPEDPADAWGRKSELLDNVHLVKSWHRRSCSGLNFVLICERI